MSVSVCVDVKHSIWAWRLLKEDSSIFQQGPCFLVGNYINSRPGRVAQQCLIVQRNLGVSLLRNGLKGHYSSSVLCKGLKQAAKTL